MTTDSDDELSFLGEQPIKPVAKPKPATAAEPLGLPAVVVDLIGADGADFAVAWTPLFDAAENMKSPALQVRRIVSRPDRESIA